ncbi:YD repeat protein [Candidatus Vecturithrix granuli]|uniref:YD repeat protein n=1 Tax=Vecturithrix granuli TaxID=1499967 RepID=A0A081BTW9_VECG1|nr:YD repeat protein [Candidatus Vecturithrix granuli]
MNLGGGIGGLLNLKQDDADYAYLYDGKGNVETVLNASQSVVAAYRYDQFGVLLANIGSLEQPYGFSTKRYNAPVGMMQYEFRNYFPELARWDRRDPLGEQSGLNLYAFVGNNPVNWVDPFGLAIKYPGLEKNAQAMAELNGKIQGYLDFLPGWLLEMLLPVNPQDIVTDAAMNLVCPLNINSGKNLTNKSIKELIDKIASDHARKHNPRMLIEDIVELISEVIQRGDQKLLPGGREAYYDDLTGRIVILDPLHPHGGTSFLVGREYFNNLMPR